MNRGKICISISAAGIDELISKMRYAEPVADVIEVRFDLLESGLAHAALEAVARNRWRAELLATNRPPAEAVVSPAMGRAAINAAFDERARFWENVLRTRAFAYVDLEEDLVFAMSYSRLFPDDLLAGHTVIGSFHDFYSTPDLGAVLNVFEPAENGRRPCDIVKIATTATTITDTIEEWYLLDWAERFGMRAVPISMGEPGKWTRILGLAHGAAMAYAALDDADATAPGQISARDLTDVYRIKDLTRETEVLGVIAGDTAYSMSPYIHNAAFAAAGMDRVFVPLQVDDLKSFITRMVRPATREIELNFRGFAVTNPHKRAIIEHLDSIDDAARVIGAVNTVTVNGEKLFGTNTDADGFIAPLLSKAGNLRDARVAVIGAGGAARACVYALKQHGADVAVYARRAEQAAELANEMGVNVDVYEPAEFNADIVVNTTPLGTRGHAEGETPVTAEQLRGVGLVYDLTYNPEKTVLLAEAERAGCDTLGGLAMLVAQGAKQFELWTGKAPDTAAMHNAARARLSR